jgi:DNA-binding LacI/PurR family transcriptional regulator
MMELLLQMMRKNSEGLWRTPCVMQDDGQRDNDIFDMGMHAMQQLFEQAPDINGVFVSDDIALGALTAAV